MKTMCFLLILGIAKPSFLLGQEINPCDKSLPVKMRSAFVNCLIAKSPDVIQTEVQDLISCTGHDSLFSLIQEVCERLPEDLQIEYLGSCIEQAGMHHGYERREEDFKDCRHFAGFES